MDSFKKIFVIFVALACFLTCVTSLKDPQDQKYTLRINGIKVPKKYHKSVFTKKTSETSPRKSTNSPSRQAQGKRSVSNKSQSKSRGKGRDSRKSAKGKKGRKGGKRRR